MVKQILFKLTQKYNQSVEFAFFHASGVYVFCVKAWIDGISSASALLTIRCCCKRALPTNWGETTTAWKLVPHMSGEMSFTSTYSALSSFVSLSFNVSAVNAIFSSANTLEIL
uniref:Uncharacterized protein n=1 Tax=Ciona intestinalis TaxID=7719 RepID=H2XXF3_CIOIN